jgi:hypothetical protein
MEFCDAHDQHSLIFIYATNVSGFNSFVPSTNIENEILDAVIRVVQWFWSFCILTFRNVWYC